MLSSSPLYMYIHHQIIRKDKKRRTTKREKKKEKKNFLGLLRGLGMKSGRQDTTSEPPRKLHLEPLHIYMTIVPSNAAPCCLSLRIWFPIFFLILLLSSFLRGLSQALYCQDFFFLSLSIRRMFSGSWKTTGIAGNEKGKRRRSTLDLFTFLRYFGF